jgi:hypothetical protein
VSWSEARATLSASTGAAHQLVPSYETEEAA